MSPPRRRGTGGVTAGRDDADRRRRENGTGQRRVSKIEHGDIEHTRVDTLRRYAEALGGTLHIEIEVGGKRMTVA